MRRVTLINSLLVSGLELPLRVDISRRRDTKDSAQVIEVGLRRGALLELARNPLALKLGWQHRRLAHGHALWRTTGGVVNVPERLVT